MNGLVVSSDWQMASAIATLATDLTRVAAMRASNVAQPPEQEWSKVAVMAVREYERGMSLARG